MRRQALSRREDRYAEAGALADDLDSPVRAALPETGHWPRGYPFTAPSGAAWA